MSPELMYQKFLLKINKGNTEFNIACDKARFVLIINEVKNVWEKDKLKFKDSILIDDLQGLVVTIPVSVGVDKIDYFEYTLPKDFFEIISAQCEVERGKCKKKIYSREIKNQNKNLLQFDENQKPDFDFEWTIHQVIGNTLRVYKTDFNILKTVFSYYKTIPYFDVEGYITIDNVPSTNIEIPLQDRFIDEIINYAAEEFLKDYQNQLGVALAKDRNK